MASPRAGGVATSIASRFGHMMPSEIPSMLTSTADQRDHPLDGADTTTPSTRAGPNRGRLGAPGPEAVASMRKQGSRGGRCDW